MVVKTPSTSANDLGKLICLRMIAHLLSKIRQVRFSACLLNRPRQPHAVKDRSRQRTILAEGGLGSSRASRLVAARSVLDRVRWDELRDEARKPPHAAMPTACGQRACAHSLQATARSGHGLTRTNDILNQLRLVGTDLADNASNTLKMFYEDAQHTTACASSGACPITVLRKRRADISETCACRSGSDSAAPAPGYGADRIAVCRNGFYGA
jgi:hypothetical protein